MPDERDRYCGESEVTLLYFDDCTNWQWAAERLDTSAAETPDLHVTCQLVETDMDA